MRTTMGSRTLWRQAAGAVGLAASIIVAASTADTGCAVVTDLGTDGYVNAEAGAAPTHCDAEAGCTGSTCTTTSDCAGGEVCCFSTASLAFACGAASTCAFALCTTNAECGTGGTCTKQTCAVPGQTAQTVSACSTLPAPICTPVP